MALAERGRSVEVVAVVRTEEEFAQAEAVLRGWGKPSGRAKPDAEVLQEVARIERAILQGTVTVLEESGRLQAATKRSVALEKQVRRQAAPGLVRHASTGLRKRKRRRGSMRTLALQTCALGLPHKLLHGYVLRICIPADRDRTGRSTEDKRPHLWTPQ